MGRARVRGGDGRAGAGIRIEREKRGDRLYVKLGTGKGREKRSLVLGYVTEEDAERALTTMLRERDEGTESRVWALYERGREGRRAAARYLIGDPGVEALLPKPEKDWSRASLGEYHREIYAPWRADTRPASWRTEDGTWRRILRDLGKLRVRDLDAHVVADYLDGLLIERAGHRRHGEPVSGATKRLHRNALQALTRKAFRDRHLEARPDLAVFRIEGSTTRADAPQEPLDLDELLALLEATARPNHRAMFAVGAGQGLRPSELVRVRWEDIDLDDRTLAVRGTKTTRSSAIIPLTPLAHQEIRTWWVRCGEPAEGIAFPARKDGTPYTGVSGYKRALATAATNAGISRPVTPYLLRHSFATIAWSVGIDRDVARRIMRHTDEAMLDRVYARPRPAELQRRLAAFSVGQG